MVKKGIVTPEFYRKYACKEAMPLTVQGTFSSAIYLKTEEGKLLLLHDRKYGRIPFGIGICDFEQYVRKKIEDMQEMPVSISDGRLSFPHSGVCVELEEEPDPVLYDKAPHALEILERLREWRERLRENEKGAVLPLLYRDKMYSDFEPDNVFAKVAREPLCRLEEALLMEDGKKVEEALRRLIGLGIGLTPSLDDFLNGFQYTLQFAARIWKKKIPGLHILTSKIAALAQERTNVYSSAYLLSIARGERFSVLDHFLDGPCFMSREAGSELLAVGASSGADMMTGIIRALTFPGVSYKFDRRSKICYDCFINN